MTQRAPRAQVALFLTVLTLIGCSATGPEPARFEELLLAGAIRAVTLNVCSGPQGRSSEGSVEIEWQAYERRTRAVVLTSTIGGTAKSSRGGRDAYYDAAAAALRNLLAQEAFVKAVGSTGRAQLR